MPGLLLILLSCDRVQETAGASWPDPAEHLDDLNAGLDEAMLMWQGAQPEKAQAALEAAYRTHFEPFEEPLAESGVDTLAIEYDFARIGWRMRKAPGRRGAEAEELSGLLLLLRADIEEALGQLPPTPHIQSNGEDH